MSFTLIFYNKANQSLRATTARVIFYKQLELIGSDIKRDKLSHWCCCGRSAQQPIKLQPCMTTTGCVTTKYNTSHTCYCSMSRRIDVSIDIDKLYMNQEVGSLSVNQSYSHQSDKSTVSVVNTNITLATGTVKLKDAPQRQIVAYIAHTHTDNCTSSS